MLFYWIWPLLLALVPIAFRIKRIRFAFMWIVIAYFVSSLGVAIILPFSSMLETGAADPQLVAGQISENLVTSMLGVVINIPLALLVFWGFKKFRGKTEQHLR